MGVVDGLLCSSSRSLPPLLEFSLELCLSLDRERLFSRYRSLFRCMFFDVVEVESLVG
jgi:hypothetical protein